MHRPSDTILRSAVLVLRASRGPGEQEPSSLLAPRATGQRWEWTWRGPAPPGRAALAWSIAALLSPRRGLGPRAPLPGCSPHGPGLTSVTPRLCTPPLGEPLTVEQGLAPDGHSDPFQSVHLSTSAKVTSSRTPSWITLASHLALSSEGGPSSGGSCREEPRGWRPGQEGAARN